MSNNNDREYARPSALPNWLKNFADKQLEAGPSTMEDIKNLLESKSELDSVEARVKELRDRVGLDIIEKVAGTENESSIINKLVSIANYVEGEGRIVDAQIVDKSIEVIAKKIKVDKSPLKGYIGPIETQTIKNKNFRKVLFTGEHSQLVVMSIKVGEELGSEVHSAVDQFFRIEQGEAKVKIDSEESVLKEDMVVIIPAGSLHNIVNVSDVDLKLYTIYTPPNHPDGTVHKDKAEADEYEKEHHHD